MLRSKTFRLFVLFFFSTSIKSFLLNPPWNQLSSHKYTINSINRTSLNIYKRKNIDSAWLFFCTYIKNNTNESGYFSKYFHLKITSFSKELFLCFLMLQINLLWNIKYYVDRVLYTCERWIYRKTKYPGTRQGLLLVLPKFLNWWKIPAEDSLIGGWNFK